MNWSSFAKIKASLILVFIFGVYTFFLGFIYNQLPESLSDKQKQFISLIGSPAVAIFLLTLINSRISEEVEADVKQKLDTKERDLKEEKDKSLNNLIVAFMNEYNEDLKKLDEVIKSLNNPQLQKLIDSLILAGDKYKAKHLAEEDIAKWFDIPGNKSALVTTAQEAVLQAKCNIPQKYKQKFDNDIRQCINWLQDSIEEHYPCKVKSSRDASIIGYISYKPYEVALISIEKHIKEQQELKEYYEKYKETDIVKKLIDHLIEQLKSLSA